MEYLKSEQLMIALAGKQRQMRLIPVKALDQPDTEWIKVADTKGCIVFATGVMRQSGGQTAAAVMSGSSPVPAMQPGSSGGGQGGGGNGPFCLCVAVKRQVIFLIKIDQYCLILQSMPSFPR